MRFDLFVSQSLKISKNKAKELIQNKQILLNESFYKPSFDVSACEVLNLKLLDEIYVSRAALKLRGFLEQISLDVRDKTCLDIGSSAGGFTQILLEKGAKSVTALDIGTNQLHQSLREDSRVKELSNTDLREFKSESKFELITCDLSFISLKNLLFYIDNLALKDIILLFKPQFEVGKEAKRDKKGVLKDEKEVLKARLNFEKESLKFGWILRECQLSSLKGKEGNVEYFYYFSKFK